MAPNARSVLSALKWVDKLGKITSIANGHGPLLRFNLYELVERYRIWSEEQSKADKTFVVFYISDYEHSDRLSQVITREIIKAGVAVEILDHKSADPQRCAKISQSLCWFDYRNSAVRKRLQ